MDIAKRQQCSSWQPYHNMYVASDSHAGHVYMILVCMPNDKREDWICSCPSWRYRGTCKHLDRVSPCYWREGDPEKQGQPEVCPRCGGPTYEELVIDE